MYGTQAVYLRMNVFPTLLPRAGGAWLARNNKCVQPRCRTSGHLLQHEEHGRERAPEYCKVRRFCTLLHAISSPKLVQLACKSSSCNQSRSLIQQRSWSLHVLPCSLLPLFFSWCDPRYRTAKGTFRFHLKALSLPIVLHKVHLTSPTRRRVCRCRRHAGTGCRRGCSTNYGWVLSKFLTSGVGRCRWSLCFM